MAEPGNIGVDAQSATARASNLISSDRVEGTQVHLNSASSIGHIQRLMIDKHSGQIVYAVIRIAGMDGQSKQERAVPWKVLTYDTNLQSYRIDTTDEQIRSGPTYPENTSDPTFDPAWEEHVHKYFNTEPYWNSETNRATDVPFGKKVT
jgi:sporulation protein YlmC with PRC-barrel domain